MIKLLPPINKIIKTHGHRLDSYRFKSLDSYIMKTNYLVVKKKHLTLLFSRSRVHKCVEETNQVGLFYAQKGWHIALLLSVGLLFRRSVDRSINRLFTFNDNYERSS